MLALEQMATVAAGTAVRRAVAVNETAATGELGAWTAVWGARAGLMAGSDGGREMPSVAVSLICSGTRLWDGTLGTCNSGAGARPVQP